MENLKFKDIRKYIAVCAAPISVCMIETSHYENYWEIGDIPDNKYDDLYLYGIGQIQSEFYDRYTKKEDFCYCIEIVLSKTPRFKDMEINRIKINDFLKMEDQDSLRYDFSNDCSSKKYVDIDNIKSAYEKFFAYMDVKRGFYLIVEKGMKIVDPDSESLLLQEIYKKLWGSEDHLKYCINHSNHSKDCITGDTMNSVNTTLNQAFPEDKSIKCRVCKYADKKKENKLDKFLSRFDKIEGLKKFISLYHTIGNFIPFPCGCNGPRGTGKTNDYWDLALLCIYKYYKLKEEKWIEAIVGNKKDDFIKWLKEFGSWDNFVEKNYLQDFVRVNESTKDEDQKYGSPKELWEKHLKEFDFKEFENKEAVLPTDKEQIEQFCKNASEWILARGQRMIDELRIKMHETDKTS